MSKFNLKTLRNRFNITFSSRIFLGYFIIAGTSAWFLYDNLLDQIKPTMRQSVEYTLVDNANLLAEIFSEDVQNNQISKQKTQAVLNAQNRTLNANIWSKEKTNIKLNFYITDRNGIVIFDSNHQALVGQDYSRWRDVFLTLKGQYGARSTPTNPNDPQSSVMHVAAPIYDKQKNIIGVLTVYTPNLSLQPFLELSKSTTLKQGLGLILITTIIGGLLSFWLSRSISKIVRYAQNVGNSKPSILPKLQGTELNKLADAIEQMRTQLEGKAYVENYVQALTHELKSPIAAIKGSIELMSPDMPSAQHEQFSTTIFNQAKRLEQTIDQMFKLAALENIQKLDKQEFDLKDILKSTTQSKQAHADIKQLHFVLNSNKPEAIISANQDLVLIAINNLLDNALDFAAQNSQIEIDIQVKDKSTNLVIKNLGEPIPDFAKTKLFDRFYSLPRPNNQPKSTGLGLSFVRQIMDLHQGLVLINNLNQDDKSFVLAVLVFPD